MRAYTNWRTRGPFWAGWGLTLHLCLLLSLILSSGCASGRREALREKELLSRHPAREVRMAARPLEGYLPASVWRVQGKQNTVYLAGTCHVLGKNEIPFPSPFYAAYRDSQEIYLEMESKDPGLFTQLRLVFKMHRWMKSHQDELLCPKDRKLSDYLTTNTVARLKAHYGKHYPQRERMSPLFAAFLGGMESMAEEVDDNGGVDEIFELLARRDRKPIQALDDDSVLDSVTLTLDSILMDLSVDIAHRGADVVIREEVLGDEREAVVDLDWRRGDLEALDHLNEEMKTENPSLYAKLLPERNRKWMEKILAALQGNRNVMVLVGAAHMGGEEGLLELLRKSGYKIEQMYGVDEAMEGKEEETAWSE